MSMTWGAISARLYYGAGRPRLLRDGAAVAEAAATAAVGALEVALWALGLTVVVIPLVGCVGSWSQISSTEAERDLRRRRHPSFPPSVAAQTSILPWDPLTPVVT